MKESTSSETMIMRALVLSTVFYLIGGGLTRAEAGRAGGHLGLSEESATKSDFPPSTRMVPAVKNLSAPDPNWCSNGELIGTGVGFCLIKEH